MNKFDLQNAAHRRNRALPRKAQNSVMKTYKINYLGSFWEFPTDLLPSNDIKEVKADYYRIEYPYKARFYKFGPTLKRKFWIFEWEKREDVLVASLEMVSQVSEIQK